METNRQKLWRRDGLMVISWSRRIGSFLLLEKLRMDVGR